MPGKRRLQHEALESRRLLAADCGLKESADIVESNDALQLLDTVPNLVAETGDRIGGLVSETVRPLVLPRVGEGPDFVQEHGDKLFVVDQQLYSGEDGTLYIFERLEDGSLETVESIDVGFPVQRMIVAGDQVLLFGDPRELFYPARALSTTLEIPDEPKSSVVTVNLGDEIEVVRQEFDLAIYQIHQAGDRILTVARQSGVAAPAIFPPPPSGLLTMYDITPDGLSEVASDAVDLYGMTAAGERDFYSLEVEIPDIVFFAPENGGAASGEGIRAPDVPIGPTVNLSRYALGDDAIDQVASLDLGKGFPTSFEVAPDGQTAVVIRSHFGGVSQSVFVDMLDLSEGQAKVFETIELSGFYGHVHLGGPDYVVLRSYQDDTLAVIDVNQDIDINAENRVRRIELPEDLWVHYESLRVTDDRLVLYAERTWERDPTGLIAYEPQPGYLLTVSLSEARIIGDARLPATDSPLVAPSLFLIDSETERLGIYAEAARSETANFLYGHLGEDGEFDQDGTIESARWRWQEIDADADRLIAREASRILEYDWADTEDPVVIPLGELPPLEAVNDEFTLFDDGEDHLLDVLANDQIPHDFGSAEIVEIAGAPEGTEVINGRLIKIPADALDGVESLRFEYVITDDGIRQSSAVVEVEVESIDEAAIERLVQAIRQRAAEDLQVSIDDVVVTSVERLFDQPLPIVLPNGEEIDLSPGILVLVATPDATALYAASLDGEIILVFTSRREFLVDLGVRAVDENGQVLEEVTEGDNFWLEFTADDLRAQGEGVYAAFYDLIVPTEHLVITGPVEYADGFRPVGGGEFDEGEIDDLGAVDGEFESPGGDLQAIYRIGVQAVGAGEVTLQPEAADEQGTETLIRGNDFEVPLSQVRYTSTTLTILEESDDDPLDVDGNGQRTALDALLVINFLAEYGNTYISELEEKVLAARGEGEQPGDVDVQAMYRLDTNQNGQISALDALVVINGMYNDQLSVGPTAEGEQVVVGVDRLIEDDEDDEAAEQRLIAETMGN